MRRAFTAALGDLMDEDDRIVLLTADLGYHVLEPLISAHPQRVINVGVAEQNMAGAAAGLAHSGRIPFIYSIATFASLRGYEFIRNGAVVHDLPVRIIGIGGGFEYGAAGISHYALEDYAIMRAQPGMTVVAPADAPQAVAALRATWNTTGPVYYRVGKNDRATLSGFDQTFHSGRIAVVKSGTDVTLLGTGAICGEMLEAAERLEAMGVSCGAAIVACLAPSPAPDIVALLNDVPLAVTVETHYLNGGLGSLVAEVIADNGLHCRLLRVGVDSVPDTYSGSQSYMERRFGLDAASLVGRVLAASPALGRAPVNAGAPQ